MDKLSEVLSKLKPLKRFLFQLLMLLILIAGFTSCEEKVEEQKEDITVVVQQGDAERVSTENSGVVPLRDTTGESTSGEFKSAGSLSEDDIVSDLPLVLIAEVDAIKYKGTVLRSTHVCVNDNYVYVSYNYEGSTYLGAIDMIDINDPNNPMLVESAVFPETDISSLAYANNALYMAGAKEFIDGDDTNPALIYKMTLDNGYLTDDIEIIDMPGQVATDIDVNSEYIFGVSGDNGIVGVYSNQDNSLVASETIENLLAVKETDGQLVALQNGRIHVFNASTLNKITDFETSADVNGSKRTIDFYSSAVLASEGANGTGIYNLSSGEKMNSIPVADATGLDLLDDEKVVNGVSVNEEHIFIANGGVGVSLVGINDGDLTDLTDFGSLDLEGSVNYVKSEGDFVFVADGFGGLKILKMVKSDDSGSGSAVDCAQYPEYKGGKWLNVNGGETLAYNGSASVKGVNVNAKLTWCGSLAVSQNININSGGEFYMKGSLATGSNGMSLAINSNSKMIIEGSVVIYGNLVLNSNSTLEFAGSGSSITIYGNVVKGNNVTITGTYTDTFNKLN